MFIVGMNVVRIGLEWKVFSGLITFHPNSAGIVSDRGQFKFSSIMATLRPHTASPSFHEPRWIGQGWDPLHGPDLIPSCSCTLTLSYLLTGGPALGPILKTPYPTLPYPPHPSPPLPFPSGPPPVACFLWLSQFNKSKTLLTPACQSPPCKSLQTSTWS